MAILTNGSVDTPLDIYEVYFAKNISSLLHPPVEGRLLTEALWIVAYNLLMKGALRPAIV